MAIRNRPVGAVERDEFHSTIHLVRPDQEFLDRVRPKVPSEILRTNDGIPPGITLMKQLDQKEQSINRMPLRPSSADILLYVATDEAQAYPTKLAAAVRLSEMNNTLQARYIRDQGVASIAMGSLSIAMGVWMGVQSTYLLATAIANDPSASHKGAVAIDAGFTLAAFAFFKNGMGRMGEGVETVMRSIMARRAFKMDKESGRMRLKIAQPEKGASAQ